MGFRDLGLKSKIVISAIAPAFLAIVVGSLGMGSLYMVDRSHRNAHDVQTAIRDAGSVQRAAFGLATAKQAYEITGRQDFLEAYRRQREELSEDLEKLRRFKDEGGDIAKLIVGVENIKKILSGMALDGYAAGKNAPSSKGSDNSAKQSEKALTGTMAELQSGFQSLLAQRLEQAAGWIWKAEIFVYPGVAIIVIVGLFQSYSVGRQISNAVGRATALAEATTKGDLSARLPIENSDEVGRLSVALNEMTETLAVHTRKILEGVSVLASSTAEISATSSQLSETASKTASAVTETTTTVEEVKEAAKVSSEKALGVEEVSKIAVEISNAGKEATEGTVSKMHLIKEKMGTVGEKVINLSENTQDIEEIISAVQDLADQSNLLAVNASIEAARAGEQGKGFSIVAQEIKSLSDQSRQATDQVRNILEQIRRSVSAVVLASEHGGKAVDEGVGQSVSAGKSIEELSNSILESSQSAGIIAASSEQQFVGVDQVASAMKSIQTAMEQNVEGTRQLESEATRLADLGETLKGLVEHYRL